MWLLICLFFPSIIALGIHKNLFGIKEKFNYLLIYVFYNILINFIILLICFIGNNHIYEAINEELFTINFSVKYLGIAILLSCFIPYALSFLKNNVSVTIRRKSNEKKKNKKNK